MHIFLLFLFSLVSLISPIQSEEQQSKKSPPAIPDPLELHSDWWTYFKVPPEVLPAKIQAFQAYLNQYLLLSKEGEHQEIIDLKTEIFQNLQLLQKKTNPVVPQGPHSLQLRKAYTPQQILDINRRLMLASDGISQLKDKIDFEKTRMSKTQTKLDKHLIEYRELPEASYEKLFSGLKIILLRIKIAIHKSDLAAFTTTLAFRTKEQELLSDELKTAKNKVDYTSLNPEALAKEAKEIQNKIEVANGRLSTLEKKAFIPHEKVNNSGICCLISYQITSENIGIEYLLIQKLVNEVEQTLCSFSQPEMQPQSENVQKALSSWTKTLSSADQTIALWQKQLEQGYMQISTLIAESVKKNETLTNTAEQEVSNIHLEMDRSLALIREIQYSMTGAKQLFGLVQNRYIEEKGLSETWLLWTKNYWFQFLEGIEHLSRFSLFYVNEHPVTFGVLIKAILALVMALIVSRYLRRMLAAKIMKSSRFSKPTKYITLRLVHYALLIIALFVALSFIGVDLTNIFIVAGALGVGIGFGLQSMVNNIISGFTLLLGRYVKIGDIIEIESGSLATVIEIHLQFMHVCTFDGADKIIPNSKLSTQGFTNWTMKNTFRRVKVPFSVPYGIDKIQLQKILVEAVKEQPYVLKGVKSFSDPKICLIKHEDCSVNFELLAWVNLTIPPPQGTAQASLLWIIDDVLAKEGIEIPPPKRILYVKEFPTDKVI